MVCKMVASKLLVVVGVFLAVNYAAGSGQCMKSPIRGRQCPSTWSQWQDKCYKKYEGQVTWEDGKLKCIEMDGVMVVPQSKEELQHLLNMTGGGTFWIGCNDIDVEGTWVCLDGEGTIDVQDKRWHGKQPDNYLGDQDCAAAIDASGWRDRTCSNTHKLICQRPVSPALLLL